MDHRIVRLETENVPAFQIEHYMPPQDEMKYRVDFMYTRNEEKDPDRFWSGGGRKLYREIDSFTDQRKAMEQAVSQIILPTDTPEEKLQNIYARCQKIRNTTFEPHKTKQEHSREKLKTPKTSRMYGSTDTETVGKLPGSSSRWPVPPDSKPVRS